MGETTEPTTTYLADLESIWRCYDAAFESLGPSDWSRKHGKDWTVADVPYHLAYFDRELVVGPIERGTHVSAAE